MRIKRSVARFFGLMVLPAVTIAVVGYFGTWWKNWPAPA
jgi:hypothetical protein